MSTSPFANPFESKGSLGSEVKPDGDNGKDNTKPAGKLNADDIETFLNDDDDKTPPKKDDKLGEDDEDDLKVKIKKDDKVEEDDEEEDKDKLKLKEDDDDEDKEKLDLKKDDDDTKLDVPPRKKDISAKYPKFFEEFPFFDKMMFRDKAYTEMFGSFDEAKEVFSKVERLNEFETQLLSGDTKDVLSTVKAADPKAFDKIVDNYLKSLHEVDPEAYKDVTENFTKRIILGMVEYAKKKDDKELDKAAKLLHEFIFDTDKWEDIKVRVKEERNEESEKIEKERADFLKERFEVARDTLTVKVDNILKATISEYIDPRGTMTPYEKKNAIAETLDRVHKKIAADPLYKKNLDRLWKAAFGDKFSVASIDAIKKSYLGRANNKTLADMIKEVRSEVLKGDRSKGSTKEEKEETPSNRKIVNAGRPHQQEKKANERQKGETVEDFLARD